MKPRAIRTADTKPDHPPGKLLVPSVDQAARVLLCLAESSNPKMGLTEISRQVGIYKSKGYSILNTLGQYGFIEKDPQTKTYSLGPSLIFLSRNVLDNLHYPEIVGPYLEGLAKETSGTTVFGIISGSHVFVVSKREGNQNLGFGLRLGHRFHITLGAHGKAMVAFMPREERERILSRKKLHFYGDPSRFDPKRLEDDLARCRESGYTKDFGEVTPGVTVISAPVFGLGEKVVGCLVLMGGFSENVVEECGPKLAGVARQISHRLGAHVESIYPF